MSTEPNEPTPTETGVDAPQQAVPAAETGGTPDAPDGAPAPADPSAEPTPAPDPVLEADPAPLEQAGAAIDEAAEAAPDALRTTRDDVAADQGVPGEGEDDADLED